MGGRKPYYVNGTRVPGVTTILGKFKDPGALMYWSWNCANSVLGETLNLLESEPNKFQVAKFLATDPLDRANYRGVSGRALTAGNIAHDMVEQYIKGDDATRRHVTSRTVAEIAANTKCSMADCRQAHNAVRAFTKWVRTTKFELLETEIRLTSEEYMFGGMVDCIGIIDNKFVILDWKTSKALYTDYLLQIAAYKILWDENWAPPIHECHLVRFDKETGDFEHRTLRDVEAPQRAFLAMREAYEQIKIIEKK